MRKLMYVTIGFAAACALCVVFGRNTAFLPGAAAAALAFGLMRKKHPWIYRLALVFMGCTVGMAWFFRYDRSYLNAAAALDGATSGMSLRVTDYSYETGYGRAVDGTIRLQGKIYQVKAYLDAGNALEPGQQLTGEFRFRFTTPDGAEEGTYHAGKGIFLLAYQRSDVTVSQAPPDWLDVPARLRHWLKDTLKSCFPEDTYPFAKALLIGDGSDLTYGVDTDLKISGIRHIVAVSGLHVSILFTLVSMVTLKKRWLAALAGFPVLLLFAAVAGFTPSVTRACIMSALMLLALLLDKEYDGPSALSFAVLVMLVCNPLTITSVSFQLSVGSVAGIFLFAGRIRSWLVSLCAEQERNSLKGMLVRWFTSSVSVSLSAIVVTTPLCAWHFGTISLIGVVTNLLTLWVISFLFYGIMGVCVLFPLLPQGAALLARGLSVPIRYVLWMAGVLADVPMAAVYTESIYITAWLVFAYVLLAVFLADRHRKPLQLGSYAALGLCLALLLSWAEPMLDDVRFTVLDVGQGQCLLFQTEGKTYMVDCGGDSDRGSADLAAQTLLSQGITRLDGLILTHLDRDHAGGAENLLSRMETALLVLPPVPSELARKTEGEVIYASQELMLDAGGAVIRIFPPTFPGNSNENSLCILFETEKCVILATGDRNGFGERSLLRSADIPDVDILVAGHHGSKNSTCEELLAAVRPEIVCISVGKDNSYGHPAPELLRRLADCSCAVYRTDRQGTITIRR